MEALDLHSKWMIAVFIIGYIFITLEHLIHIDKATIALLTGIICWVIQFANGAFDCSTSLTCLGEHVSNIAQVVFFLLGALAIVEIMNVHRGFSIIVEYLNIQSKRKLLWVISILTFILSGILDNLTTTIVMVTLLQKLIDKGKDRLILGAAVVIAANAGGAWTPIGDVTTTMLWIGGQVSTIPIMKALFLPSIISLIVSVFVLSFFVNGNFPKRPDVKDESLEPFGRVVFFLGLASLVFVPIFKVTTGLPPFMGVFFGLSLLWIVTDLAHSLHPERTHLRMNSVFSRIQLSGLLFFLGILLAINALDSAKVLEHLAVWLENNIGNTNIIATFIGLASSVIDNVPLVAATMGMYSLEQFPTDHSFWELIAYCAGTGGSILIIGSAAGIVYMGLEKVDFFWYLKNISLSALAGYFAGIAVYLIL